MCVFSTAVDAGYSYWSSRLYTGGFLVGILRVLSWFPTVSGRFSVVALDLRIEVVRLLGRLSCVVWFDLWLLRTLLWIIKVYVKRFRSNKHVQKHQQLLKQYLLGDVPELADGFQLLLKV